MAADDPFSTDISTEGSAGGLGSKNFSLSFSPGVFALIGTFLSSGFALGVACAFASGDNGLSAGSLTLSSDV